MRDKSQNAVTFKDILHPKKGYMFQEILIVLVGNEVMSWTFGEAVSVPVVKYIRLNITPKTVYTVKINPRFGECLFWIGN